MASPLPAEPRHFHVAWHIFAKTPMRIKLSPLQSDSHGDRSNQFHLGKRTTGPAAALLFHCLRPPPSFLLQHHIKTLSSAQLFHRPLLHLSQFLLLPHRKIPSLDRHPLCADATNTPSSNTESDRRASTKNSAHKTKHAPIYAAVS